MIFRIGFVLIAIVFLGVSFLQAGETMPTEGIIDIHAHIGQFKGFVIGLDTLVADVRRYKVRMALISNLNGANLPGTTKNLDEVAANRETADALKQYTFLRGLAWARPTDLGSSPKNLEPFLRDHGFVGMKFHPKFNGFRADDPRVDPYLDLCEKYNVPAVFHSGEESSCHPRTIYRVAKRHPKVVFVLYHMVFFGPSQEAIDVAEEAKRKGDARIYLEISQTPTEAILKAVHLLGSEYVLFGSDATYYGEDHYGRYVETLRVLRKSLSPKDYSNIIEGNAIRLFRLK